jgi:hypothetical protein
VTHEPSTFKDRAINYALLVFFALSTFVALGSFIAGVEFRPIVPFGSVVIAYILWLRRRHFK